jgi:phospholipid/cholesterol/gamma-HCH transport system substrate-binding protein
MQNKRQLALGVFFLAVLALLAYYTLFWTDFRLFGETHRAVVHFPEANGLRQGDTVLVAGVRAGRVLSLAYDPRADEQRRITIELSFEQPPMLREGATIEIEDSTLLGGKQVRIDPGPPQSPELPQDAELLGTVAANPLDALGELVGEITKGQGVLARLTSDAALADKVQVGLDNFATFSANVAALTDDVRAGKGVFGRLFTDEELATKLNEIADRAGQITADLTVFSKDLAEGKGTLAMLAKDEIVAEDVRQAVRSAREVIDRINAGEGSLGRLVVDPSAMDHLQSILTKIDEGQGDLGKLINESAVYDKLAQIADDLTVASAALREGQGSLGKLLYSDELYDDLRRALELVIKSLEEYREAAPVTTFTSVLFGAF